MFQTHKAFNRRIQDYHWIYNESNGADIGWMLSKSDDIVDYDPTGVQVVGGEGAYQIVVSGEPSEGLFNELEQAKRAAEKIFLNQSKVG